MAIEVLSDADWASKIRQRRGRVHGRNFALPLEQDAIDSGAFVGESEFNPVVKAIIAALANLQEELWDVRPPILLGTDASACKSMLLRVGTGRLKHMSTKQVWAQGAVAAFGVRVQKIPRSINSPPPPPPACSCTRAKAQELKDLLFRMGNHLRSSGED